MNVTVYIIYLTITLFITFYVGRDLHKKGAILLQEELQDQSLVLIINRFLLLGYYLLNMGYAALVLSSFPSIHGIPQLISALALRIGIVAFSLGLIHFFNLYMIHFQTNLIRKLFNQHLN